MPYVMTAKVTNDTLGRLVLGLVPKLENVLDKAAHDVEGRAKALVPVDTGATKNSITVSGNGLERRIGPSTEYAPSLEFGTVRMAARPFLTPAIEQVGPGFARAVGQLFG